MLVFCDDDFFLSHHDFPGTWFLHEFSEIDRDHLPTETELILTPTALNFFSFTGKVVPVTIDLILIHTLDRECKSIVELVVWSSCCHERVPLPEYTNKSHLCVSAWSISEIHDRICMKVLRKDRTIIFDNASEIASLGVKPEAWDDRIGSHKKKIKNKLFSKMFDDHLISSSVIVCTGFRYEIERPFLYAIRGTVLTKRHIVRSA